VLLSDLSADYRLVWNNTRQNSLDAVMVSRKLGRLKDLASARDPFEETMPNGVAYR
jgi:hypothetical protein